MAISSLPQDTAAIVNEVELFFDSLPLTRRRRSVSEIDDAPENENYITVAEPLAPREPDNATLDEFRRLLRQLGQARSDVLAEVITVKIYRMLGLEPDGGK